MFTREDGPTALRADLIQGLSFSTRSEEISTAKGAEPKRAVAGVASVWNGKTGFIAVLIRFLDPPRIDRYVYSEPLTTFGEFESIASKAVGFGTQLGFKMDAPEFASLGPDRQEERLRQWNRIRKSRPLKKSGAAGESSLAASSSAVLGKVSLVRKGADPRRLEPLGHLLSFF